MIKIAPNRDLVTLINHSAPLKKDGALPGIISAVARSKDGTRLANFAPWKSAGNWERLFRIGSEPWFRETTEWAKPNGQPYEFCYGLDKTGQQGR